MVSNRAVVMAEKTKMMDAVELFLKDNGWDVRPRLPGEMYIRVHIPVQYGGHEALVLHVRQEM